MKLFNLHKEKQLTNYLNTYKGKMKKRRNCSASDQKYFFIPKQNLQQ